MGKTESDGYRVRAYYHGVEKGGQGAIGSTNIWVEGLPPPPPISSLKVTAFGIIHDFASYSSWYTEGCQVDIEDVRAE